jgi:enediyne biosynthesis protein E4
MRILPHRLRQTGIQRLWVVGCLAAGAGVSALVGGCDAFRPSRNTIQPAEQETAGESPESASAAPWFVDRAPEAGIEFVPTNGVEAEYRTILETLGVGVALFDFDLDGHLDILVPGGGLFGENPSGDRELIGRPPILLRNEGDWQFTDATEAAGLVDSSLYSHGVSVGDYDGDGYPDVLITGYHGLRLYRNQGDGTFVEVTVEAGLTHRAWSTSAAWGDVNGDGVLDLYVVNYVDWSLDNDPPCSSEWGPHAQRFPDTCPPERFNAVSDWLFLGDGLGGFDQVGTAAGLVEGGKGLAVLMGDVDLDGSLDIFVANDATANFLYRNRGDGTWEEIGQHSGTAFNPSGEADGSMGVDLGDYDGDGLPDIWVTNYETQMFALYRNLGDGLFYHGSGEAGIGAIERRYVGFGTCFFDFDRDGYEDLFAANGHVKHLSTNASFHQEPLLLRNQFGKRFVRVNSEAGGYMESAHMGRGVAVGDVDNDGNLDLVVAHTNQPIALLSNETLQSNSWLMLRLIGTTSHRDAVGSRIVLRSGGRQQTRQVKGGTSYLSTSDRRVFFGLGSSDMVDELTVYWPSGTVQKFEHVSPNQFLTIHEGRDGFHDTRN